MTCYCQQDSRVVRARISFQVRFYTSTLLPISFVDGARSITIYMWVPILLAFKVHHDHIMAPSFPNQCHTRPIRCWAAALHPYGSPYFNLHCEVGFIRIANLKLRNLWNWLLPHVLVRSSAQVCCTF